MFRHYLAAALRNLVRNRLHAAINIVGLAVGFAAALLVGLYVHDEVSYERWVPGYQDVYRLSFGLDLPGQGPDPWDYAPGHVGPWFKLDFPDVQAVARLSHPHVDGRISLRHGDVEGAELVYWADPVLAEVLPMPVVAGNLAAALNSSTGIALTRRMARKYFGRDDPIGEILEIDRRNVMTVGAVLEDLPSNTHLAAEIIGSGLASFSELTRIDAAPGAHTGEAFTYFRLAPGASVAGIVAGLPDFLDRRLPPPRGAPVRTARAISHLDVAPIADIHFRPPGLGAMKPAGNLGVVYAVATIAALLVMVAGINFVNLMTARAARRALEVGVRKAMGAQRIHLIVQFLGESVIYAMLAIVTAILLARCALPGVNGILGHSLDFSCLFDPAAFRVIGAFALLVGVLAGAYPALILSAFRPTRVFRRLQRPASGAGILRYSLVMTQFAVLIALVLSTAVIYRQTSFAVNQGLRFSQDPVVIVETSCGGALHDEVRKVPGVLDAACAGGNLAGYDIGGVMGESKDGRSLTYLTDYVDFDFFRLYGIKPLAGR
ncbi:MAG: ABC transporter permease, partial [Rhodospirillaceae bacterium]